MVRVEIKGYNHELLLSELARRKIDVFDVKKEKNRLVVTFSQRNLPALIDLCEKLCYTLGEPVAIGRKKRLESLKRNSVLVIGIVLAVISCVIFSGKIGNVTLADGGGLVSAEEIKSMLAEYGVKTGELLSSVNTDYLENQLSVRIKDAEYVLISRKGRDITVTVTARSKPIEQKDERFDIVAVKDGTVTKVVVIVGTPVVKVGDKVTAGQVLIKGQLTYADGSTAKVKAQGRVYAEVSVSRDAVFIDRRETFVLTGESMTLTEHEIFGYRVKSKKTVPFGFYEKVEYVTILTPAPVKRIRVIYNELKKTLVDVKYEEVRDELIKRALELAESSADFEIKERITEELTDNEGGKEIRFVRATVKGNVLVSDG